MTSSTNAEEALQTENKPRGTVRKWAIAAAVLSLAISAILLFIVLVENELTAYGPLSSSQKTLYATASTVLATILTTFIISRITATYLCRIDDCFVPPFLAGRAPTKLSLALVSSWQEVLGVGPITNKFRPHNWGVIAMIALAGLVTTCITAGFTPTTATRETAYASKIPSGDPTIFATPYLPSEMPDPPAAANHSAWWMKNGSIFYSWSGRGGSPAHEGMQLAHGINIIDPTAYAYEDEGVAVHSSAIGAPYSVYAASLKGNGSLSSLLNDYKWNVQDVSACVPVMVRNPFKCRKGGKMDWVNNDHLFRLYSEDASCMVTQSVKDANDVEMLKWWCTHDEIGQATVLLGANFNYHAWLAVAVNDDNIPPYKVPPRYTYSIQCEVDARDVFEYRKVVLRVADQARTDAGFSRILTSEGPCSLDHESTITNTLLATVATANQYLLLENVGNSGWFETVNRLTTRSGGYGLAAEDSKRSPPWAFNDSSNALEDILGLVAALVGSRVIKNSTAVQTRGVATITFTRIGTGNKIALLFAIPPLLSAVVLIFLCVRIQGHSQGYESSNPLNLVYLGKAWGELRSYPQKREPLVQ